MKLDEGIKRRISNETLEELSSVFEKAVREAFEAGKKSVEDKPTLKTEKRHAKVGERILITNSVGSNSYKNGDVGTVKQLGRNHGGGLYVHEWPVFVYARDYEVITEPEQVPIIKEEPETIEHEGLLLRRVNRACKENDYVRVQHEEGRCFKPNKLYGPVKGGEVKADSSTGKKDFEKADVYNNFYGRDEKTVEVFEVVKALVKELTPNEQRDELRKKARGFVEKRTEKRSHPLYLKPYIPHDGLALVEVFIVNEEKRTVVCLLKGVKSDIIYAKGIAKWTSILKLA